MIINDIDVTKNLTSVNRILDKGTSSDVAIRGYAMAYPSSYQIEKISITLVFDIYDSDSIEDFMFLAMELDEYPLCFIESEEVRAMSIKFTDKIDKVSSKVFFPYVTEKIFTSIDASAPGLISLNVVLLPFPIYSYISDYVFVTYEENADGTFNIKYNDETTPETSRVYQDFFRNRKEILRDKVKKYLLESDLHQISILSPYFSNIKPDNVESVEIKYYGANENSNPLDKVTSILSEGSVYGEEVESFRKTKYVYWKGDSFSINDRSKNAIQSIEVSRVNILATNTIVGSPTQSIQYIGKGSGSISISMASETIVKDVSDYTVLNTIMNKYDLNTIVEPKFSRYNILKLVTLASLPFSVEGYVPSQAYTESDSDSQSVVHKIILKESNPSSSQKFLNEIKSNIDSTSNINLQNIPYAILSYMIKNRAFSDELASMTIEEIVKVFFSKNGKTFSIKSAKKILEENKDEAFSLIESESDSFFSGHIRESYSGEANRFFSKIMTAILLGYMKDSRDSKIDETVMISDLPNSFKSNPELAIVKYINLQVSLFTQDSNLPSDIKAILSGVSSSASPSILSISNRISGLGFTDLKLSELFIEKDTYVGEKIENLSACPFIAWVPAVSESEMIEGYDSVKVEIDKELENLSGELLEKEVLIPQSTVRSALDDLEVKPKTISVDTKNLIYFIGENDAGQKGEAALDTLAPIGGFNKHGRKISSMTVRELTDKQVEWSRESLIKYNVKTSAAGQWQAMRSTLIDAVSANAISMDDVFNRETQERFAVWAATKKSSARKGAYKNFINKKAAWLKGGSFSEYKDARTIYADELSKEWAILANPYTGRSYYDKVGNNKAKISIEKLYEAMDTLKVWDEEYSVPENSGKNSITTPIAPTIIKPKEEPKDKLEKFKQKWDGIISKTPNAPRSSISKEKIKDGMLQQSLGQSFSEIEKEISGVGYKSDLFNEDLNAKMQSYIATTQFRNGFNNLVPVFKVYIVIGSSTDPLSEMYLAEPIMIEIPGILSVKMVDSDSDNPISVATVTMTNFGNLYTDEEYFTELYKPTLEKSKISGVHLKMIASLLKIKEGNRIHIKSGYSNNPGELTNFFTGVITETAFGEVTEILCEGYGKELVLNRRTEDRPLSTGYNSSTVGILNHVLLEYMEVESLGRKADGYIINIFRNIVAMLPSISNYSGSVYSEPESRSPISMGVMRDSFIIPARTSYGEYEGIVASAVLKNIFSYEIVSMDNEFSFAILELFSPGSNRNISNIIHMTNNTLWDIFKIATYRHPGTVAKVVPFDTEATIFYGLKDQLYFSKGIRSSLGVQIEMGNKDALEMYKNQRRKRMSPVTNTHIISSGVNLISNSMRTSSSFDTRVNVSVLEDYPPYDKDSETQEQYEQKYKSEKSEVIEITMDDNLIPSSIRTGNLEMNGCDSKIAALRYGTRYLMDSVSKMYDGNITVVGNQDIRNGDRAYLYDATRGIFGAVHVSNCVHIFNPVNGYITSFTPRLIVEQKWPTFSFMSRKMSYAGAYATSKVIQNLSDTAKNSKVFTFFDYAMETMGSHQPADGGFFARGNIISVISRLMTNYGSDSAAATTYQIGKVIIEHAIMVGITKSLAKTLLPSSIYSLGRPVINLARATSIRALTTLGASILSSTPSVISGAASGASLLLRTVAASESLFGPIRVILSRSISVIVGGIIANPIGASLVLLASMVVGYAVNKIEFELLKREPITIMPVMVHDSPYVSGIVGIKSDGLVLDSVENVKRTIANVYRAVINTSIASSGGRYLDGDNFIWSMYEES